MNNKLDSIIKRVKVFVADTLPFATPSYRLRYRPLGKEDVREYEVSRPFGKSRRRLTCYCYGRGVRSFLRERIVDREVLAFSNRNRPRNERRNRA